MGDFLDFFRKTWAEIDISALKHNIKSIKALTSNCKFTAVVKANAYGHTVEALCPYLNEENAISFFAVSSLTEAIELRNIKVTKPILILGYTPPSAADSLYKNDIIQAVFSKEYAAELNDAAKDLGIRIKVHIKLDTGMGRLGFDCRSDELKGLSDALAAAKLDSFEVLGVFTHFAESDRTSDSDDGFTDSQHDRFIKAVSVFKSEGFDNLICHSSNSAATLIDDDKYDNLVRVGIALYGLSPNPELELKADLKPVMSLKTVVTMVKEIDCGDTVSYGRTFKAEKKMKIATLAAGYADGYPRFLSNKGYVLINGQRANIVGRVCMDQMCVDVTDLENVSQGDEVLLFGKDLSVDTLAKIGDTINYEIVCGVSKRVPRITVNND